VPQTQNFLQTLNLVKNSGKMSSKKNYNPTDFMIMNKMEKLQISFTFMLITLFK